MRAELAVAACFLLAAAISWRMAHTANRDDRKRRKGRMWGQ